MEKEYFIDFSSITILAESRDEAEKKYIDMLNDKEITPEEIAQDYTIND